MGKDEDSKKQRRRRKKVQKVWWAFLRSSSVNTAAPCRSSKAELMSQSVYFFKYLGSYMFWLKPPIISTGIQGYIFLLHGGEGGQITPTVFIASCLGVRGYIGGWEGAGRRVEDLWASQKEAGIAEMGLECSSRRPPRHHRFLLQWIDLGEEV